MPWSFAEFEEVAEHPFVKITIAPGVSNFIFEQKDGVGHINFELMAMAPTPSIRCAPGRNACPYLSIHIRVVLRPRFNDKMLFFEVIKAMVFFLNCIVRWGLRPC